MSSQPSLNYTFRKRLDDFSGQVSCDQDSKFWFRLEIENNRDNITDFFLGAFDPALGGELLTAAYRTLNRQPQTVVVFGDILSSREAGATAVADAKDRLTDYAREMLTNFGRTIRGIRSETRRNKIDLVIET